MENCWNPPPYAYKGCGGFSFMDGPRLWCIALLLLAVGCNRHPQDSRSDSDPPGTTQPASVVSGGGSGALFTEITGRLGFNENPPRYPDGKYFTPEITPGGVAVFDYDNDGRLDILVVAHPPPAPYPQALSTSAPNRLF